MVGGSTKNGLDERNDVREVSVQFYAYNQLTVINTWFQKKSIHYSIWKHPTTKLFHIVDLAVIWASRGSVVGMSGEGSLLLDRP